MTQKTAPKDCLEDAYELLTEAGNILTRARREYEKSMALEDFQKESQPDKVYSWDEIITIQTSSPEGKDSSDKFLPGKNWRRLLAQHKAGRLPFTNEDLLNRPTGLTMVGNLAHDKSLRAAIRKCFGNSAKDIIALKTLSVEQINEILIKQLTLYKGLIPKAKEPKSSEGQKLRTR